MKSLLILILVVALAAAAYFTRPTEEDFHRWFKAHAADSTSKNWLEKAIGGIGVDYYLDHCTYQNNYLWANIVHDGTVVYSGAFAHWFQRNVRTQTTGQ